jgi:type I restriction enzyme S subunit
VITHRAKTILGDIPPDWNTELVGKLLSDHQSGDWGDDEGECAIRVLRSTNFTDRGTLDFGEVATRYFTLAKTEGMWLRNHDLLVERSGGRT